MAYRKRKIRHRRWIPKDNDRDLFQYERYALGLDSDEKHPFTIGGHHNYNRMCIHSHNIEIRGSFFQPTIEVDEEIITQQPFDLGGYFLLPEFVEGMVHDGDSKSDFGL